MPKIAPPVRHTSSLEHFNLVDTSILDRTLRCPISSSYSSSTTYIDDLKTYGFCYIGGEGYHQVDTSCRGSTVYYTGWSSGASNPSGSYIWYCLKYLPLNVENLVSDSIPSPTGSCVTATIYTSSRTGFISSRANHIYCDTREPMSRYFMEHPSDCRCTASMAWRSLALDFFADLLAGTTAGINSADESETVTVTGSRRTLAGLPSSTSTDDSDSESRTDDTRPSEPGKGGPSPGVIAGAVIGALAGVALIAGALILGFRIGRQHPALDNQESGSKKTFRDTISSLPRPTIAWSRPNAKGTPERDLQNDVSVLQVNFSDDTTTKRASELPSPAPQSPVNQVQSIPPPISPQPYSTAAVESHRVELPTGLESQGWARSDAHPLPYEVDAQPQTHEVDGTPNNRTSSP